MTGEQIFRIGKASANGLIKSSRHYVSLSSGWHNANGGKIDNTNEPNTHILFFRFKILVSMVNTFIDWIIFNLYQILPLYMYCKNVRNCVCRRNCLENVQLCILYELYVNVQLYYTFIGMWWFIGILLSKFVISVVVWR